MGNWMNALEKPRFLITAGGTREKIDAVRDWGNHFTGNTGLAIARALAEVGEVDLLTSNRTHLAELSRETAIPIRAIAFASHGELKGALSVLMGREQYAAVMMTAAVSDYRPQGVYELLDRRPAQADGQPPGIKPAQEIWTVRNVQAIKVKSHYDSIAVLGHRTEKLVDLFRTAWAYHGLLVKFKLEAGVSREDLLRVGEQSRIASGADYLVANSLEMVEGTGAGAYLLGPNTQEWIARSELASRLARLVRETRGLTKQAE